MRALRRSSFTTLALQSLAETSESATSSAAQDREGAEGRCTPETNKTPPWACARQQQRCTRAPKFSAQSIICRSRGA